MNFKASRLVNKAYLRLEKQDYPGALLLLQKAQKAAPKSDEVLAYLGEAYIYNEKYDEAKNAFDQRENLSIKAPHLNPYIEGYRGRIFFEQGDTKKAEELIDKAIAQEAVEPEILHSKALLLQQKNNNQQAIATMRKIDVHDPAFYHRKMNVLIKKLNKSI